MLLFSLLSLGFLSFTIYYNVKTLIDLKDYYKRNPDNKYITILLLFIVIGCWIFTLNGVMKYW